MTDHFPDCALSTLSGWPMIIIVDVTKASVVSRLRFFCELRELGSCLIGNAVPEKRSRISTEEN